MLSDPAPLSEQEIDELISPDLVSGDMRICVAVSGGADSMALLKMVSDRLSPDRLKAATVDHGLRPGSAREAQSVAQWCQQQGISHVSLKWHGVKPTTRIQAAAREARYRLLASYCAENGCGQLWTAHNADDQAETVFARLARGSGARGLAGMPVTSSIASGAKEPVRLVRPLLQVPRARLRATAMAQELPIVDDPSNLDPKFERVRRRAFLSAMSVQDFLSHEALLLTAARMRQSAELLDAALQENFTNAGGYFHGSGAIVFCAKAVSVLTDAMARSLLEHAIEAVSGQSYPVELGNQKLETVRALPNGGKLTDGGAMILRSQSEIWVFREPSALLGRANEQTPRFEIGRPSVEPVLWDKRIIARPNCDLPNGAIMAPVGAINQGAPEPLRLALSTLPGIWHENQLLAVPHYAKKTVRPASAPWNRATTVLDMTLLTAERFARRIMRF